MMTKQSQLSGLWLIDDNTMTLSWAGNSTAPTITIGQRLSIAADYIRSNGQQSAFISTIRRLMVGQTATFPAERNSYVKSLCARFGFEWDRKFTSAQNTRQRTVTVTRIR